MELFPHELTVGDSMEDGLLNGSHRVGFSWHDMAIIDPLRSSCGRFETTPDEYGLSTAQVDQLNGHNEAVHRAVEASLDAGCAAIQAHLGIKTGDLAAMHFDGLIEIRSQLFKAMAEYLICEVEDDRRRQQESQEKAAGLEHQNGGDVTQATQIAQEGIVFKVIERDGIPVWVNREPMLRGSVEVVSFDRNGVPIDLETEVIQVNVRGLGRYHSMAYIFTGRKGMNDTYLEVVGYRPDDEEYEPDPKKLLAQLVEMLYRHVTGDDL